jgi:hypothetical protein
MVGLARAAAAEMAAAAPLVVVLEVAALLAM